MRTTKPEKKLTKPVKRSLTVHVTQAIIDWAVRRKVGNCVISRAVQAAFKALYGIHVSVKTTLGTICFTLNGVRYICLTPKEAARILVDFDQGDPVKPTTFQLRIGRRVMEEPVKNRRRSPSKSHGKRRVVKGKRSNVVTGRRPKGGKSFDPAYGSSDRTYGLHCLRR